MNYFWTTLLGILGWTMLSAQSSTIIVKGGVRLPSAEAVSGNVLLLHSTDSTLITGDFFVDGAFAVETALLPPFLLQLTSLEFADTLLLIQEKPLNGMLTLPPITVRPPNWELAEVMVKSKRPTYQQKADGSVEVTVANTLLATSNSVEEILSNTPEIRMDDSGELSVLGKGAATIFVDGRRVLPTQLATILPTNIHSIEIIRNPSARYDAEGNAVIHIHTIGRQHDGQQLRLSQNVEYSSYAGAKGVTNVQAQAARGDWNFSGFYNFERGRDEWLKITTRDRADEDVFFSSAVTTRWRPHLLHQSRYGGSVQRALSPASYWSFDYSGQYREVGGTISNQNILEDDNGAGTFRNLTEQSVIGRNHAWSFNYQQQLDTLGSSVFVGAQYNLFNENTNNAIAEESLDQDGTSNRGLRNLEARDIHIATLQVDWTKALSPRSQLEAGLKGSYVTNGSNTNFLVTTNGIDFAPDELLSNVFQYRERIAAAYASWRGQWRTNWQYTLGLRTEYTDYDVDVSGQAAPITDRYLAWFPSLSLNYRWSSDYQINWSYRAGINRQRYQDLNPALVYQDPFTSIQGNPFLLPERVQALEMNVQLQRLRLNVGYNYTLNPMGGAAVQGDTDRSYVLKDVNDDYLHSWYTSLNRGWSWKWWSAENILTATYSRGRNDEFGLVSSSPRVNWYAYSAQRFSLPADWNLELLFWWQSDLYDGTVHREPAWSMTLSVARSFWNDQLQCRLVANDIFHTVRADGDYRAGVTDITFINKWNSNYFRLVLSANLGDWKANRLQHKRTGQEEVGRGG